MSDREGYSFIAPIQGGEDYEAGWGNPPGPYNRLLPAIAHEDSTPNQHVAIMTRLIEVVKTEGFTKENAALLLGRAAILAAEKNWKWEQEEVGELKVGDIVRMHPFRARASEGFEPSPMLVVYVHGPYSIEASGIHSYSRDIEAMSSAGTVGVEDIRSKLGHAKLERIVSMYRNSLPSNIDPPKLDAFTEEFRQRWQNKLPNRE